MHIPFPVHSHLRCKSTIFIRHRQRNRRKGRPATPLSEASSASASRPIYMEPHVSSMCNHVFHIRGTICFIYVEQSVPRTWNCVFHLRGTMCFIYVEPCVPRTWNCAFHIHGTLVELRFIRTHSVQRNCRSRAARCSHTCGRFPRCLLVVRA